MATAAPTPSLLKAGADDARRYWLDEGRAAGGFLKTVDPATNARGLDPMFAGIKIIDCDTHYTEPPDLWVANAPAGMKDRMPHVERHGDVDKWVCMGRDFGSMGGNVIDRDGNKLLGRLAFQNYDQIDPGSYDLQARLRAMDAMGIWGQVCFQNGGVTQAGSLVALDDEPLAIAITRIYNDACHDRMVQSGGRVNCMATLPYWDRTLMNAELRRIVDLGIKGITLPDRPERLSQGYLAPGGGVNPFWEEVFDTCNATGLAMTFHLNASLDAESAMWDNLGFDQRLPMSALIHHIGCATTMSNFMVTGILDTYEDLKIGLIESGAGWVPFWLEGMEHQLDEFRTLANRGLKRRPREYFAKNFWVSFWFETAAVTRLLDEIGSDRMMFQTDYPHPTSLYPDVQDRLVSVLGGLDRPTQQRLLQDNAATLFSLDLG
ncbi:MAG: amidohydrolase family protein [Sphingomonadales bacterium]|nr:amidohydrolase family protein [Sphingomonadales bacterium]